MVICSCLSADVSYMLSGILGIRPPVCQVLVCLWLQVIKKISQFWFLCVKVRCLFKIVGHFYEPFFFKVISQDLEPNGESLGTEATGDRESRFDKRWRILSLRFKAWQLVACMPGADRMKSVARVEIGQYQARNLLLSAQSAHLV